MRLATLIALVAVGIVAAIAGAAFAGTANTSASLSTSASTPTTVNIGSNSFTISVWATGSIPSTSTGDGSVTTAYSMATDGTITASTAAGDQYPIQFTPGKNYSSSTFCPASGAPLGCASNPYVLNATLDVASGTPDATTGTLTVNGTGSTGLTVVAATGNVQVSNPAPVAPGDPGAPYLDAGSATPNNTGAFTVDWTASSTSVVTYTLQKHDASTGTWTTVASGLTTNSYTFSNESEGSWTYQVEAVKNSVTSNWATDSAPIVVVDKSGPNAPTVSSPTSAAYTDGSNNWYKDSVTVSFAGNGDPALADTSAGSGVASVTTSQTFDSSNVNATTGAFSKTGYATDYASNISSGTTVSGYVDWKAPTVSVTPTTASVYTDGSGNNWWKDTVSFTVAASDPAPSSGLATDPSGTLGPYNTGGTVAAQTAVDNVGHSTSSDTINYNVDTTAPAVSCTVPDTTVWYKDDQTVTCTASDTGSGLLYSADASFTLSTSVSAGDETNSATTPSKTVYDNVGHATTVGPYTFKIDRKAPQQSSCDTPDGNWHASDVTLNCTYTDGGSGPASQQIPLTTNVSAGTETANAAASAGGAQACDAVGNCAASPNDITGNKIDRKAPAITLNTPADGASYLLNQTVAADYGCTDGGSGVATCTGTAANGSNIDTSTVGSHSFSVSATDNVGNSAGPVSHSFTVGYNLGTGFLPPLNPNDTGTVLNTGNAGKTYPIKWQLTDAKGNYVTNAVTGTTITQNTISCESVSTDTSDPIDATATGGTSLRYDSTANQYVYNWQTPTAKNTCYRVTFTLPSGQKMIAAFQLK